MADYFCRIITEDCTPETETRIHTFFREKWETVLSISSIQPYWKNPGQGEISCTFTTDLTIEETQYLLADQWIAETAASGRSSIHCPGAVFLWLSAVENEENHG